MTLPFYCARKAVPNQEWAPGYFTVTDAERLESSKEHRQAAAPPNHSRCPELMLRMLLIGERYREVPFQQVSNPAPGG